MKILLRSALLSSLALAGCEKSAPPPIAPPVQSPTSQGELPPNHPPLDGMPADHPPVDGMPADHPPVGEGGVMSSAELLEQVEAMKSKLEGQPRSFEISASLGNLYYDNGRFGDASVYYGEALQKASDLFALREELKKNPVAPAALEATGCAELKEVEPLTAKAREHLKAGRRAEAQACADLAAVPLVPVLARRANGYFLIGRIDDALAEHARALEIDPDALDSLYFTGALLFDTYGDDLAQLERARTAWQRFARLAPKEHPRAELVRQMLPELEQAISLGGASKLPHLAAGPSAGALPPGSALPPNHPPFAGMPADHREMEGPGPISPEMIQAIENTPRGPELEAALDESVRLGEEALARNDGDEASNHYRSVIAFRPSDGRVQAGMAAAQILKKSGMAKRVFLVAVSTDPSAVDALAERMKENGNLELAKTLWTRLAELNPRYAAQANLEAKIKQ